MPFAWPLRPSARATLLWGRLPSKDEITAGCGQSCDGDGSETHLYFHRAPRYGMQYADPGVKYYERKYRERTLSNLKRRARQLGYELVEEQELTPAVS